MSKDIVTYEPVGTEIQLVTSAEKYEVIEADLNKIQMNLQKTADDLASTFPDMIAFAEAAQHPKMYEALAKTALAIATINKDAANVIKQKLELYETFRKPSGGEKPVNQTYNDSRTVTNNFTGTASDLLDLAIKQGDK